MQARQLPANLPVIPCEIKIGNQAGKKFGLGNPGEEKAFSGFLDLDTAAVYDTSPTGFIIVLPAEALTAQQGLFQIKVIATRQTNGVKCRFHLFFPQRSVM